MTESTASNTEAKKPKKETARERLARLSAQQGHNQITPATPASGAGISPQPSLAEMKPTDPPGQLVAGPSTQPPASSQQDTPVVEETPNPTAEQEKVPSAPLPPLPPLEETVREEARQGDGQPSTDLTKRETTEVDAAGRPAEGQFVTDDDLLMMTLARPDNVNMNVRLDADLAEWFEDVVDEAAYETRMTKAAITTLAFRFLKANWDTAVTEKLPATRRRRRRR